MGRSLGFYALDTSIAHDETKKCKKWEYQRTLDEMNLEVTDENDLPYTWDKGINLNWCPRCLMFTHNGLSGYPGIKDTLRFHHSYSNPIWYSKWNFYRILYGNGDTDFCNRFDSAEKYSEIDTSDIEYLKTTINEKGNVHRPIDIEALDECKQIISFCEKWLGVPGMSVIYASES